MSHLITGCADTRAHAHAHLHLSSVAATLSLNDTLTLIAQADQSRAFTALSKKKLAFVRLPAAIINQS